VKAFEAPRPLFCDDNQVGRPVGGAGTILFCGLIRSIIFVTKPFLGTPVNTGDVARPGMEFGVVWRWSATAIDSSTSYIAWPNSLNHCYPF
jgi:hypothetical protein